MNVANTLLACACALAPMACGTSASRSAPPASSAAKPAVSNGDGTGPSALAPPSVETDDPLTWRGEPYAQRKEAPELSSPRCAWLAEAVQRFKAAKTNVKTEDALLAVLADAAKERGPAGPPCLELFQQGLAAYLEATKNGEGVVHLKMIGKHVTESTACLETAPPVPRTHETAPYRSTSADWATPGWSCLEMDYLVGQPSRFRLAFAYDAKSGMFAATAERLDDPKTVLFIRGKASDPAAKVVMRRVLP